MCLDNVVQIGSEFQAEIPDCISGIILLLPVFSYLRLFTRAVI